MIALAIAVLAAVVDAAPEQVVPALNDFVAKRVDNKPDFPGPQEAQRATFTLGARRPELGDPNFIGFQYNCTNGVRDWGRLGYGVCEKGKRQSPIDITADGMAPDSLHSAANVLHFDFHEQGVVASNEFGFNLTAFEDGVITRTSQVLVAVDQLRGPAAQEPPSLLSGPGAEYNSARAGYTLTQVTFRTPAEHLVAGVRFALEIQLQFRNDAGERLAVGVFGRVTGDDDVSPGMLRFGEALPTVPLRGEKKLGVHPSIFVPRQEGFWAYNGSDTLPPCNEGVLWLVMHHPVNVTKAIVDELGKLTHAVFKGGNARTTAPVDLSREVAAFPNPSVMGETGGDMLMPGGSAPLSSFERRSLDTEASRNRTKAAKGFTALPEANVIDMAKAALTNSSSTSLPADWQALEVGRPKIGAERPMERQSRAGWMGPAQTAASLHAAEYSLGPCTGEYAMATRFIGPQAARDLQAGKPVLPGVYAAPDVPPGADLLRPLPARKRSVTSPTLRRNGVDQAVQVVGRVLRPLRK